MLSELAFPHIRCCLSAIPSDLMKSTAVDESLSSMNQQFCSRENQLLQTIGLVSDCLTVTVHAGKCFKALIDSGDTISLMCTSLYNMIEDCYKTSILPAVIHLRTVDGSPMSFMGKATLHLCIANVKFSHTFFICDRLLETDFLLGLTYRNFLSYCWDLHQKHRGPT